MLVDDADPMVDRTRGTTAGNEAAGEPAAATARASEDGAKGTKGQVAFWVLTIVALLAIAAALAVGGVLAWRELSGAADSVVTETLRLNRETLRVSEAAYNVALTGHLAERFTRAVEQLGHNDRLVRAGGIYALGGVANDSPGDSDTILTSLTAYLRQPALAYAPAGTPESASPASAIVARADTQAVLTVLQRLPAGGDELVLDLRQTDLRGLDGANFRLHGADLAGARLDGANLTGANLSDGRLENATLSGSATVLRDANLRGAFLEGANLRSAHLEGADLRRAELDNTSERPGFEWIAAGTDLRSAYLQGANVDNANLTGACLQGVDLREVLGLKQRQLDAALTDDKTRPPAGLEVTPDDASCHEVERGEARQ
jgi:uncharacterized protein YjbI with pentapeptide repeats